MPNIEERIEAACVNPNYAKVAFTDEQVANGAHRNFVGGRFDTHGKTQFDFLVAHGLRAHHRLLDVGCGSFRAGRSFIDYLEPGHYYGIDAGRSVMQAGYDVELNDEQRSRLPIENLRANDRFDGDFGVQFDFALAQSVFSHVSLNHIKLCLFRLGKVVRPGGTFFATFIERPNSAPLDTIFAADQPKPYYHEKNAFWYPRSDLQWAAGAGPWKYTYIGDWGHPGGQKMVQFVRLTDEEIAAKDEKKQRAAAQRRAAAAKRAAPPPPLTDELRSFARRGRKWAARRLNS